MQFAALEGETGRAIVDRHRELRGVDSLVLVTPGVGHGGEAVAVRSEAVLQIARYLGGVWHLTAMARVVPRPVRDWGYAILARNRYRLFGRYDACPVPSAEVRTRFLP